MMTKTKTKYIDNFASKSISKPAGSAEEDTLYF